ncbi:MAG: TRAP transporter large permease [Spirochaetia bacterium]|jgi:C4-dicarboxylate transporter DctM subunit|nr:TRAP transporter large permease [Spirochaetia bacterium]
MSIGIFFLIFFVLLFIGTPFGTIFGGLSVLPSIFDPSFPYTVEAAIRSMVGGLDSFTLLAVPLFMLSGYIMAKGGISKKLFNFFAYFIGNKTGGLPCAAILTCMFYGAISGSSPATVSAVGAMTIPFLLNLGYDEVFVTAIVTVAGGLGVIIPPSISYIVFASVTGTSPAALFLAGIIPGILVTLCLMFCAILYCKRHGEDKVKLQQNYQELHTSGFWVVFKDSFFALMCPIIILGSIYGGLASPTEAATISIVYALILCLFVYRTIKFKDLWNVFSEGVKSYITILFIIAAATAFGRVLTMLRFPQTISEMILGNISNKVAILLIMNVILLVFGMIMDNIPNIMVLTPILFPIATAIGVNPIHFGIIMTMNLAIGMVTPPMGINLFIANSMTNIPIASIAKKTVPFLISFLFALMIVTFVPQVSLALIK